MLVVANQKPGRSSLYTEQHEKHTLDFEHVEYKIFFLHIFFEIQAAVE